MIPPQQMEVPSPPMSDAPPQMLAAPPPMLVAPPSPYTPGLATPPVPVFQPYQPIFSIPGAINPGAMIQLPPVNPVPVPIYDVRNHNNMGSVGINENLHPSHLSRELYSTISYCVSIDNMPVLGFTVSVPLKKSRRNDTVSCAEIAFERDVLYGDFYDRICAGMELEPKDAMLGYKFEVDPCQGHSAPSTPSATVAK